MFEKSADLVGAQSKMVEFYLSARNCRGKGNPDLLEAKTESARWWMHVAQSNRARDFRAAQRLEAEIPENRWWA